MDWRFETLLWRLKRIEEDQGVKISRWTLSAYYRKLGVSRLKPGYHHANNYTDDMMLKWQTEFVIWLNQFIDADFEVLWYDETSTEM